MWHDDIKALATLFITSVLLYVIGFYSLLKPLKVKNLSLKVMSFFHKKRLAFFYKERAEMMSQDCFLVYLRVMGVVVILIASFVLFLFIYKLKGLKN